MLKRRLLALLAAAAIAVASFAAPAVTPAEGLASPPSLECSKCQDWG